MEEEEEEEEEEGGRRCMVKRGKEGEKTDREGQIGEGGTERGRETNQANPQIHSKEKITD